MIFKGVGRLLLQLLQVHWVDLADKVTENGRGPAFVEITNSVESLARVESNGFGRSPTLPRRRHNVKVSRQLQSE